jgi:hypothetical protein
VKDGIAKVIQALSRMTTENGCSEAEALTAAAKLDTIMEKYSLSLEKLETVDPISACEEAFVEWEKKLHPVVDVGSGILEFTDTRGWYMSGPNPRMVFFGLPGDVRIACHLVKIIQSAMDMEWNLYWVFNSWGSTSKNVARKNFMMGMATRISERLQTLKQEREARSNKNREIVIWKRGIIDKAYLALGIELRNCRSDFGAFDEKSFSAGDAAGNRAPLNAGELENLGKHRLEDKK